jgi:hypothetical protein
MDPRERNTGNTYQLTPVNIFNDDISVILHLGYFFLGLDDGGEGEDVENIGGRKERGEVT